GAGGCRCRRTARDPSSRTQQCPAQPSLRVRADAETLFEVRVERTELADGLVEGGVEVLGERERRTEGHVAEQEVRVDRVLGYPQSGEQYGGGPARAVRPGVAVPQHLPLGFGRQRVQRRAERLARRRVADVR